MNGFITITHCSLIFHDIDTHCKMIQTNIFSSTINGTGCLYICQDPGHLEIIVHNEQISRDATFKTVMNLDEWN